VAACVTWPEFQATWAVWKYEPPIAWVIARYFEVPVREVVVPEDAMSTDQAVSLFNNLFSAFSADGPMLGQ
jgi:hypothetical protein